MIKDNYREETNLDVYNENSQGSYSNDYVKWLETKLQLLQSRVSGSDFKKELLKAFLAGRQLGKDNKLTSWNEEKGMDIEHSGFEGWFHYHYR